MAPDMVAAPGPVAVSGGELLSRRPHAPLVVVPRSPTVQAAEDSLRFALVANVAGNRPQVSTAMLRDHLVQHFGLTVGEFDVRRHFPKNFVIRFQHGADRDRVLASRRPSALPMVWYPWRRTTLAHLGTFKFKVLLALSRVPLHARSVQVAQSVLGPACANIEESLLRDREDDDDRDFFVTAWCKHPAFVVDHNLIFILEPVVGGVAPPDDHLAGLLYLIKVRLVAIQDFSSPPGSPGGAQQEAGGWGPPAPGPAPFVDPPADGPFGGDVAGDGEVEDAPAPAGGWPPIAPARVLLRPLLWLCAGGRPPLPACSRWRRLRYTGGSRSIAGALPLHPSSACCAHGVRFVCALAVHLSSSGAIYPDPSGCRRCIPQHHTWATGRPGPARHDTEPARHVA